MNFIKLKEKYIYSYAYIGYLMENYKKFLSITIQVLITLMLLYSLALAVDVDVTRPWHCLSQIAKSQFDLTSIDSDNNGRIDAGIIEDTLQDITNNGATTIHTINVGGLNSAGAIIASGNLNIGSGKLFVDVSTGKVGIGTTSPHGNLGIKQGHGDWITLERTAGSGYWHIHNPSTQERIEIGYTSDSGTTRWGMFVIKDNGNVGIGTTSPGEKLHVAGKIKADSIIYSMSDPGYAPAAELRTWGINKPDKNLYIEWGNSNDDIMYITDHWRYGSPLYIKTGPIHLMAGNKYGLFINTNGNVGIGTTSPTQKLDVNGNVKVRGALCLSDGCKSKWSEVGSEPKGMLCGIYRPACDSCSKLNIPCKGYYVSSGCPPGYTKKKIATCYGSHDCRYTPVYSCIKTA